MISAFSLFIVACFFITLQTIQYFIWAGFGSFFIGIGMGMTSTAFIVAIQTNVDWQVRGTATATNMFMRSIGSALGVAFLGVVLNTAINQQIYHDGVIDIINIVSM